MRVAIIGNGIVANLGALYFSKRLPQSAEIMLIGPDSRGGLPVVGESTIEITTQFLEGQLGLGQYLRRNHLPKYSLTYYFKLDPDDPTDRTYSVHCTEREPADTRPLDGWKGPMARPPAWQLNRTTFDRDMRTEVAKLGRIERIDGTVTDVVLDGASGHTLTVKREKGGSRSLKADWVIDATGRKQLLGKKLGLVVKPEGQRDCFWFRLADFDRSLLANLNALGPMPPAPGEAYHYDRYYSTHHFMGRGNWIWLIPMKADDDSELMSVGLVSRPDIYDHEVRTLEAFLENVSGVHPVVSEFVASGRVVDTNLLRRYHHVVSKVYSPDRWAIVGDAAFAPDPLFSNGLAFCTIQLEQLGEMITQDCEGNHSAEFVTALSDAFMAPVIGSQTAITNWYKSMDDAYLSSLRLNWIDFTYFYLLLPLVVNRCHFDPDRVALWKFLLLGRGGQNGFDIPRRLADTRTMFDAPGPDHFIYNGKVKINPRALEKAADIDAVREQIQEGARLRRKYMKDQLAQIEGAAV
jgi:flavin-dependent dehydrogenase